MPSATSPLARFNPATQAWFRGAFAAPTPAQSSAWPVIEARENALLIAPTGSGKTLAAFMACVDRLMFSPPPPNGERLRVVYVSPLKALGADVERNLRLPLEGIAREAARLGIAHHLPAVAVRSGDTPASERARFARKPADILITTPESLYLLLTSNARAALAFVQTIIVDEIHALVPTKRGAHLALSLERLAALCAKPPQRVGLSATQKPLDEVARFLGGVDTAPHHVDAGAPRFRPVTIIDARMAKNIALAVEGPPAASDDASAPSSLWLALRPRLLALVRAHRSTLVFVNNRRSAERLAAVLNDLAGETLVYAHHGSLARAQRVAIEAALKAGTVHGLVATSSLELGIDMSAIDLVIQVESPPSVAAALQRIGRGGHQVGAVSRGVIFPKFRADVLACAAIAQAVHEGDVEPTSFLQNPLDVLAQQIVAMVALEDWHVDALFARVRAAAPFAELSRAAFEGVLDMLAGRYASADFSELKPRLTWNRARGRLTAREGARRVAVVSGGTIPDRGLYPVFLAGAEKGRGRAGGRLGELDEEMVFETRVGETFLLGASTWRVEEVTHDRVLVSPAPGEPGKMPFWRGDAATRSFALGARIGALVRALGRLDDEAAREKLMREHDCDARAADQLVQYLADQRAAGRGVPDDETVVIERSLDVVGGARLCVLSPFGGRVHAPWAMAAGERVRRALGLEAEVLWANDGFVMRLTGTDAAVDPALLIPSPEEVEALVTQALGATALFAAKFREIAARALLLPKRRPGARSPLWLQRQRAADLLTVAARHPSFPLLLEAYRECLRDVFDLPALFGLLAKIKDKQVRVVAADGEVASPFAATLLFGYAARSISEGDQPLAERRAQALSVDHAQLRDLLGEAELHRVIDRDEAVHVERRLQGLGETQRAETPDALHDILLRLGDLDAGEIAARSVDGDGLREALRRDARAVSIAIAGGPRWIAVEHAACYRDALGVAIPPEVPPALREPAGDAIGELARRYARTHAPFTTAAFAARYGLARDAAEGVLARLAGDAALREGHFLRPEREWCDPGVLGELKRRSLAKLRREIEPVPPHVFARLLTHWHGAVHKRRGPGALVEVIEKLQGVALPASALERDILAARLEAYDPRDLDALTNAGEVVWVGVQPLGARDGRVALYLADALPRLWTPPAAAALGAREAQIVEILRARGASFFSAIARGLGGAMAAEINDALWRLVWSGVITNDGFQALRAHLQPPRGRHGGARDRGRGGTRDRYGDVHGTPGGGEGRWSLLETRVSAPPSPTTWAAAIAEQLLCCYGVVTRQAADGVRGGFSAVYEIYKAMEESGRVRRGYFVESVSGLQFALPEVIERLRALRAAPEAPEIVMLAATDPANPYGVLLKWSEVEGGAGPMRAAGHYVVLIDGALTAHLAKGGQLQIFLPDGTPQEHARAGDAVGEALARFAGDSRRRGLLLRTLNGEPAAKSALAPHLVGAGFAPSSHGLSWRRGRENL